MTPIACTLRGSLGIKAGTGRDEITVEIPTEAKSVAIVGDNGSGKSTLLNLGLTPWRTPPHIGNPYQHFGETGSRELHWTHNGSDYISLIEYQQSDKTRKQSAYLYRLEKGKNNPVGLSDGKTSTYDSELYKILGHRSIYYLSAFRAQGSAGLSDYDDPKSLLRALLGLDDVKALAKRTSTIITGVCAHYNAVAQQAKDLADLKNEVIEIKAKLHGIRDGEQSRAANAITAAGAVSTARADLDRATKSDAESARIRDRRAELLEEIEKTERNANARRESMRTYIASRNDRLAEHERSHNNSLAIHSANLHAAEAALLTARKTLRDPIDTTEASAKRDQAMENLALIAQRKKAVDERMEFRKDTEALIYRLDRDRESTKLTKRSLENKLTDLTRQAEFVSVVPCGGKPPYDSCPALTEAKRSKADLPDLHERVQSCELMIQRQAAESARKYDTLEPVAEIRADLSDVQEKSERLAAEVDAARQALETARIQEQALQTEATVLDRIESERSAIESENVGYQGIVSGLHKDRRSMLDSLNEFNEFTAADLDRLRTKRNELHDPGTDAAMESAKLALEHALRIEGDAQDSIASARTTRAVHETQLAQIEQSLESAVRACEESSRLSSEISHWTLLRAALLGVIDLTIESAGPAIAATANHLLESAYGPRFSIRIVTQRRLRNGALDECFDLSVIDSETGIESDLSLKSGGETVWIDRALSDAVAIYHQDASGIAYETLFSDEVDDGLTRERKDMLYRMGDRMLELGDFKRRVFISHDPESWLHADHVIEMGDL